LAALYHDIAKPQTRSIEDDGRIHYFNHDQLGAQMIKHRAEDLRFSNTEIDLLSTIIAHHMRPSQLSHANSGPSKRATYRFFRDTGLAGVDICLLSLADVWATYGHTLLLDRWERQVDTVRTLLMALWEHNEEQIQPPALISGHDLINHLDLKPGPIIGEILEGIREAQVEGEISTRDDALSFAKMYLASNQTSVAE
jgi:putative nucleotidyltransferase with HDIG domain